MAANMASSLTEREFPAASNMLERIAEMLAILACALLTLLSILVVLNIAGLLLFRSSILGISEITELLMGFAVFAFFPYTQVRSAHIIVDLLNPILSVRLRKKLDAVHSFIFALVAALITWRLFVGFIDAWQHDEVSMMLSLPLWLGYFSASVASLIFSLCCFYTSIRGDGSAQQ